MVIEMRDCVLTGAGGTLAGSGVAALCGWLSIQVKQCDFERCSLYGCVHHKARKRQRKKSDYLCGSQIAIFDSTDNMKREKKALRRDEKEASLANRGAICGVVSNAQCESRGRLPAIAEILRRGHRDWQDWLICSV